MTKPYIIHLLLKHQKFSSLTEPAAVASERNREPTWFVFEETPRSSHKVEADTKTEMHLSTRSGKRRYRKGCDIFWSCCSAHTCCCQFMLELETGSILYTSVESCTEIRYELWLWIEHEGLQLKWNCRSLYSENISSAWLSHPLHTLPACLYISVWSPPVARPFFISFPFISRFPSNILAHFSFVCACICFSELMSFESSVYGTLEEIKSKCM